MENASETFCPPDNLSRIFCPGQFYSYVSIRVHRAELDKLQIVIFANGSPVHLFISQWMSWRILSLQPSIRLCAVLLNRDQTVTVVYHYCVTELPLTSAAQSFCETWKQGDVWRLGCFNLERLNTWDRLISPTWWWQANQRRARPNRFWTVTHGYMPCVGWRWIECHADDRISTVPWRQQVNSQISNNIIQIFYLFQVDTVEHQEASACVHFL